MHEGVKTATGGARLLGNGVRARWRLRLLVGAAFAGAAAAVVAGSVWSAVPWAGASGMLAVLAVVLATATRRLERELVGAGQGAPLFDALTGLPGQALLEERLQRALAESARDGRRVALVLIDLDRFRTINDTFGREVGDQVLQRIARRLRALLRDVDTVARMPGDQFALVARVGDAKQAELLAGKVMTGLAEPCELLGSSIVLRFDVGMALFPDHAREFRGLLQRAETALDRARESPTRYAAYHPASEPAGPDRLGLLAELPEALRGGQLRLVYQPKRALAAEAVEAFEALIRWRHPLHGELEPGRFLPLAEQTGAIGGITRWALEEVVDVLAAASSTGRRLELAVNLSVRALENPALPNWLAERIDAAGIEPAALRLELTESALMSDGGRGLDVIERLARLGVGISLDDFGVGYSSLAYLARLPADELKIDRSFVAEMLDNGPSLAIVRATIDLAHDLNLKVVAEGVENAEQEAMLRALGCDSLQGHAVGWPLEREQLLGLGEVRP